MGESWRGFCWRVQDDFHKMSYFCKRSTFQVEKCHYKSFLGQNRSFCVVFGVKMNFYIIFDYFRDIFAKTPCIWLARIWLDLVPRFWVSEVGSEVRCRSCPTTSITRSVYRSQHRSSFFGLKYYLIAQI